MFVKYILTFVALFNPVISYFNKPIIADHTVSEQNTIGEYLTVSTQELKKLGSSLSSALWFTDTSLIPIRDWNIADPEIGASAAAIFMIDSLDPFRAGRTELNSYKPEALYAKERDLILPIASLTKIMTAILAFENLDLNSEMDIPLQAIEAYGDEAKFIAGERFLVRDVIYALLMESSNDAAIALAGQVEAKTGQDFVTLMNDKAAQLFLTNTHYTDPSGVNFTNISTVQDISRLIEYSFKYPKLWDIMKTTEIDIFSLDGRAHHWVNTDELLNKREDIIGGKTGYTNEAKGCLAVVVKNTETEYLISVVLGADQRFLETEKLIDWVTHAYKWEK